MSSIVDIILQICEAKFKCTHSKTKYPVCLKHIILALYVDSINNEVMIRKSFQMHEEPLAFQSN